MTPTKERAGSWGWAALGVPVRGEGGARLVLAGHLSGGTAQRARGNGHLQWDARAGAAVPDGEAL